MKQKTTLWRHIGRILIPWLELLSMIFENSVRKANCRQSIRHSPNGWLTVGFWIFTSATLKASIIFTQWMYEWRITLRIPQCKIQYGRKSLFGNVNPILRWAFESVRKWNEFCELNNCYHCCYIFCSAGTGVASGIRWNVTISIKMDTELLLAIWWWWPLHCLRSFVPSHSSHWLFVVLDTALLLEISGIIFPFTLPWINKLPMKYSEQSS